MSITVVAGDGIDMPRWTTEDLRAYEIRQSNPKAGAQRLPAQHQKQVERVPLVSPDTREEARWYGTAIRLEITFTMFACKPCDWDGWDIKRLQDWIAEAGLIPHDGWKALSGRVVSCKVHTSKEERTEIELKALLP